MTELRADCTQCFALCCMVPAFAASADFALDKPAGHPCPHLHPDSRCGIHAELRPRGFAGCAAYDCFGAGQRVSQVTVGRDWRAGRLYVPRDEQIACGAVETDLESGQISPAWSRVLTRAGRDDPPACSGEFLLPGCH